MAEGKTNAAIGESLHLSESAIEKYVNAIFAKLGLSESARSAAASSPSWSTCATSTGGPDQGQHLITPPAESHGPQRSNPAAGSNALTGRSAPSAGLAPKRGRTLVFGDLAAVRPKSDHPQ